MSANGWLRNGAAWQFLRWCQNLARGFRFERITATAARTLKRSETGSIIDNLGATGAVTFTLPTTPLSGDCFAVVVKAAQELRLDPAATHTITIGGAVQTAGKYISADDEGESCLLVYDGAGNWDVLYAIGTWSVEG
jgi:hypothetical protein